MPTGGWSSAPSLALLALLAGLGLRQSRALPGSGILRWYLLTSCLAALLIGKVGSHFQYLLDLSAALAILAAPGIAHLIGLLQRRAGKGTAEAAVALVLVSQVALSQGGRSGIAAPAEMAAVSRVIAQARGPVIADEPGLVSGSGQPMWLLPFEFTQLERVGRWDPRPV